MSNPDWLWGSRETCLRATVAVLYGHGLTAPAAKDLAEEAFSITCAKVLQTLPAFANDEHRRNWLVRVTVNQAIETFRTESRRRENLRRHVANQADPDGEAGRASPLQPFVEMMQEVLPRLPGEDRRLVERYYLDQEPLRILAEEFGISIATAWKRLRRILGQIREMLEASDGVPDGWGPAESRAEDGQAGDHP